MANREVNLTKRVLVDGKFRSCQPVFSDNGRIKQDWVLVNGKPEYHKEGSYYLRWREDGRHIRTSVGKNAADALARQIKQEQILRTKAMGVEVLDTPVNGNGSENALASAVKEYLADIKLSRKDKTYAAYSHSLKLFLESCHKRKVEDVERRDMLQFAAFLRDDKELEPRTVWNKFNNVMSFLKVNGVRGIVQKNDWPRFTQEEPEIYEESELDSLFKACDSEERLWFEFFLMTGMREQEVMYAYWSDINFNAGTARVSHKPDRNWTPKMYKEREIPIPDSLITRLKAHKAKADKKCPLVFPTAGCKPKLDFLDCLKACAERAELDKDVFWLHKFRATFATRCLWAGVDLRTVQLWLGHSDLESTMRYLKPSRSKATRAKVNEIFAEQRKSYE